MNHNERHRSLADVIDSEAPISSRRAMAITLAITDELMDQGERAHLPGLFSAAQVRVAADGSVAISSDAPTASRHRRSDLVDPLDSPSEAAAATGALLFELIMARPPLVSEDVFEPAVVAALPPALNALMVRSCSDFPAQWPTVRDWNDALRAVVGGSAPPMSPARRSRQVRQGLRAGLVLILLAAISIAVIVLAPRWWNGATDDQSAGLPWTGSAPSTVGAQPRLATS